MSDKFKEYLVEGKEKLKPKLHLVDDKIEKFIEIIEGKIDEMTIFNRALSEQEIIHMYAELAGAS